MSLRQGPMLIGFVFNVLLYGLMIAQVYIYYTTYKEFVSFFQMLGSFLTAFFRDKHWMKAFVHALPPSRGGRDTN